MTAVHHIKPVIALVTEVDSTKSQVDVGMVKNASLAIVRIYEFHLKSVLSLRPYL